MPRLSSRYIEDLAKLFEPQLRKAFIEAVRRIGNSVSIRDLEGLIKARDVNGALRLVGIDPTDFGQLSLDLSRVYAEGGAQTAQRIETSLQSAGYRVRFAFDVRNPIAEQYIASQSGRLIQEITADQLVMIRANLLRGMERGLNPRTVALDLIGRIDAVTGLRTGGVLGLHSLQEEAVARYVADLASKDPAVLKMLIGKNRRGWRDLRFDRTVIRAINEGTGIPLEKQIKMKVAYMNNALRYRAENIARTEALAALNASQDAGFRQAVDKGVLQRSQVRRYPITAGDARVRPSHRLIPGMNKEGRGLDELFETPDGPKLAPPFAPQCRCRVQFRVDYLSPAARALRAAGVGK